MAQLKIKNLVVYLQKAQDKAKIEAQALGVSLGSIIQFSEDNGGYNPMAYRSDAMSVGMAESKVSLPQGENVIKSKVTITYTLKQYKIK